MNPQAKNNNYSPSIHTETEQTFKENAQFKWFLLES